MSGRVVSLEPDPHVAVQSLLPWYLTGRLEAAEAAQVEAHLPGCADCRAELAAERQWQRLQVAAVAQVDVEEGWAAMRTRLGQGEDGDASARPSARALANGHPRGARAAHEARAGARAAHEARPGARGPAGWSGAGPLLRWGWTAPTALAAALLAGVALRPATPEAPAYRALAAPAPTVGAALVRFSPDATEAQIRAALQRCEGRLVDGPTVSAAWVVNLPRERYAQSLALLRLQPGVALAEGLEVEAPR